MTSETLTILFANLVGNARFYETQSADEAHQQFNDTFQRILDLIERHEGVLLRKSSDAVLASFANTDSAYLASVAIQRAHRSRNLAVRVGFHRGELNADDNQAGCDTVNLATRLLAFAEADEICATGEAVAHLSNRNRTSAIFLAPVDFSGINRPIPVYRIHWDDKSQDLAVFANVSHTELYQNNLVLDLLISAKRIRIDAYNPVVTFGRAYNNDVVMDRESVSQNHARIVLMRGRFMIHDASTNGTYLVRGGFSPEVIRKESTTLSNFGKIGLGFSPDNNSRHVIEFRITKVDRGY